MYNLIKLMLKTVQTIILVLLAGQCTIAVADDVDDLLNQAQNIGNVHLNKTNQAIRAKLNNADVSYQKSLDDDQKIHDSLMKSHNALMSRKNELAILERKAK